MSREILVEYDVARGIYVRPHLRIVNKKHDICANLGCVDASTVPLESHIAEIVNKLAAERT